MRQAMRQRTGRRGLVYLILILMMVFFDLHMLEWCMQGGHTNSLIRPEEALRSIRAMQVTQEQLSLFEEWADETMDWQEYLCMYLITGESDQKQLMRDSQRFQSLCGAEYELYCSYIRGLWEDLMYYPLPRSLAHEELTVSYADSWMTERTYGGVRGHEGCDMMASLNERGHYPVVSMTDGVVEKIGWLPKGGYRIGIRSPHGGYFYYAHLYDYAQDFQPGDQVRAGQWIGFMGDSGYSDVEGTVGNFDVHLHVGVYVNQPDGTELSFNPYPLIQALEEKRLAYRYE